MTLINTAHMQSCLWYHTQPVRLTALTWAAWRQSFELQRVLEGEKALRAEAARRLADLQRHATLGPRSGAGQAAKLAADSTALEAQIQQHSVQVPPASRVAGPTGQTCPIMMVTLKIEHDLWHSHAPYLFIFSYRDRFRHCKQLHV